MKYKPGKDQLKKKGALIGGEMLASRAFRELSAADIRVLLRLLQKRTWTKEKRKNVYTDGPYGFPYSEATGALGIGRSTFRRAIRRLHDRGFLTVAHQGGSFQGQDFSRYSLSEDWKQYGTPGFKPRQELQTVRPGHDVRSWQRKRRAASAIRSKPSTRNCTDRVQEIVPGGQA